MPSREERHQRVFDYRILPDHALRNRCLNAAHHFNALLERERWRRPRNGLRHDFLRERGERRFETTKCFADDLEIAAGHGIHERESHELHVGFSIRHALLSPCEERFVGRSACPRAKCVFDTTSNAVEQSGRRGSRCPHRAIRSRECIDVLQRRPPLDAFRSTRRQQSRTNREQEH
jgi:hypothetical protein